MKKLLALLLSLCMLLTMASFGAVAEGAFTAGEYEAQAQGFGGAVSVKVTVDENAITAITIEGADETPALGGEAIKALQETLVGKSSADEVDAITGATITSNAVKDAVAKALSAAAGEEQTAAEIKFMPGTYQGVGAGYNGDVVLSVTFGESTIENIEVVSHVETAHVGDVAFEPMIENIKAYTSTGVDVVSGATFSSRAVLTAVNDAAAQAGCDVSALQAGAIPFAYEAQDTIEDTYDVVVVGAGGAGMSAAAAAALEGSTVVVLETNAAIGGNTLMAGGGMAGFQAVADAYVFDPNDPEATTGVDPIDGEVTKSKSDAGRLATLQTILDWSEEPFNGEVTDPAVISTVDDYDLPSRGVHAEFLETLQTLKSQISVYMEYANKHLAAGEDETDLTLFSTRELHIFQTYSGGLRLNADKTEWIYGDYDLICSVVNNAYEMKEWLMEQGAVPTTGEATNTLIGCLWQRINRFDGGVVHGEMVSGNWGAYLKVPEQTMLNANEKNQVMLRTTAKDLIVDESGRVTGVKAERYDGTQVIMHATKGVVLATGGYAANIQMVTETNTYWSPDDVDMTIKTTNRSSLKGDGIVMAQAVGAGVTGMGWTQLMPLGWVDNGNLSLGAGENVIFIASANRDNAGQRYVDETAERDVLSQAAFDNGENGVYLELSNGEGFTAEDNVEGRIYYGDLDTIAEMTGLDKAVLEKTITDYDAHVIGTATEPLVPAKSSFRGTIGSCDQDENGKYLPETYRIGTLKLRYQKPSTHHTMGGVMVDTDRHVLAEDGSVIAGLYAAGEVTGGIFAGNRLGGNAIVEIVVSGRIAGTSAAQGK